MTLMDELEERKDKVEQTIDEIFEDGKEHPLWEHMAYYPEAGGKKVRPFLTMITTGAFNEPEEKAIPYGIAVEFVHNFTLVHDDIMDKDELRRGKKTLHRKVGESHAINAGDGLFALSFKILSETDIEGERIRMLLEELSSSVIRIAEGQEEDISFEKTLEISEDDFIEMIEKKTGYLFRASARGGAIVAGRNQEEIRKIGEYGRKMGIAFQIQDDYLDLVGDQDKIGKDVGSDIKEGKRTLIVIKALSELPDDKEERLKEILESDDNSDEEIREAIELIKEANALQYSKELAEEYAEEAKKELDVVPEGEDKELLEDLVDFMITRKK